MQLYVYDLSKGLAGPLTAVQLAGRQIDGVWHTSIVVFGKEITYALDGIGIAPPGQSYVHERSSLILAKVLTCR